MKKFLLLVAVALSACQSPTTVTPKPDVKPAVTSNDVAKKHVKEVRKHIDTTITDIDKGGSHLDNAEQLIDEILGNP